MVFKRGKKVRWTAHSGSRIIHRRGTVIGFVPAYNSIASRRTYGNKYAKHVAEFSKNDRVMVLCKGNVYTPNTGMIKIIN